ncbi:MAG: hypothetical protein JXQ65_02405 [Candidatus Marinimicrobia bacterium]|nr:hypothetical protein [Candidatus Neomarinimicrobiota bacterium]
MDIQSIQNGMGNFPQISNEPLTDDQKSIIEEILSQYDPVNMTDKDKHSLMEELKDTGIGPNREIRSMVKDAGFEIGRPPQGPPPPGDSMQQMKEMNPEIAALFEQMKNGEMTEEDLMLKLQEFKPDMGEMPGDFFDQFV